MSILILALHCLFHQTIGNIQLLSPPQTANQAVSISSWNQVSQLRRSNQSLSGFLRLIYLLHFIKQSARDQYPWDAIYWELWLKAVTSFRAKPQFPSHKRHLRTRPQSFPKGTCWRFKASKVCSGCRFDHICFKCGSPHPATQCSSGQQHKRTPVRTRSTIAAPQAGNTRKGDRLNFFLTGYHPPLLQFLVNGFSYGFA